MAQLIMIVIYLAVTVGWVMNIVQLATNTYVTGMVVVKAIGILVFPLGVMMGYIG